MGFETTLTPLSVITMAGDVFQGLSGATYVYLTAGLAAGVSGIMLIVKLAKKGARIR